MRYWFRLCCLVVLLLSPATGWAAIAVDAYGVSSAPSTATSKNWSHTIDAGAELILIYVGCASQSRSASSLTVGGQNATFQSRITEAAGANSAELELWAFADPPTGAQTVAVTMDGSCAGLAGFSVSFAGASGVIGTPVTESNGDGSIAVSSASGDIVSDAVVDDIGGACPTLVAGGGQTEGTGLEICTSGTIALSGSTESGAASVTMSWSGFNGVALQIGVNVEAAAGGAAPVGPPAKRRGP